MPQQQQQGNKRPRVGGKTISAETLAARRKAVSAVRSDSSSGSSSSDTDSDDDSGSSGSDSDSDSDMDTLAANISRGLSEEVVAPSPYSHATMNSLTPNNNLTPNRLGNGGAAGPRSLRDLLGKKQTEDQTKMSHD
jgi:U3 small nucleolar RNA-associated protein 14